MVNRTAMSFCEQPIVCTNGQLIRCCFQDHSYVPAEIIDRDELLSTLQAEMRSRKRRKLFSDCTREKDIPRRRVHSEPFDLEHSSDSKETRRPSLSSSPRGIARSLPSPVPQSVLLKMTPKTPQPTESIENVFEFAVGDETGNFMEKFKEQIDWARGTDYVSMERMRTLAELVALLEVLLRQNIPAAIELRVNQDGSLTVVYQFVGSFKQEFMMLKLDSDYCFFMSPF